jgi:hypothetical protein
MIFSRQILTTIFFITISVIGIGIFKDYGFGTDEHINRANGGISLNHVINILNEILSIDATHILLNEFNENLMVYKDRDYGVAFDLPAMVIERLLEITDSQSQFFMRHLLTHALFIVSICFFYKLIKNRYDNYLLGLIGALFLYASPRIFAESFYNNKDIVFMAVFLIALYFSIELIKTKKIKYSLLSGLLTGIAVDLRIVAIILPAIVISCFVIEAFKSTSDKIPKYLIIISLYFITCVLVAIALWPWLWSSPVSHFVEALKNMAKFRWLNWVFYRGFYYPSTDLPWHYLPLWILITTPIYYLILSLVGFASVLRKLISNNWKIYKNYFELTDLIFLSILIMPIFAVIFLKSTVYDGWRQFYFIYPSIIYLSIRGLSILFLTFKSKCRLVLILIVTFFFLQTSYWIITNHPYQYVFFNKFAGNDWDKKFEMDYWGISNVDALKFILKNNSNTIINIYGLGNTSIPQAFALLESKDSGRLKQVTNFLNADYVVTNFRFLGHNETTNELEKIKRSYDLVYEIKVDKKIIGSVFKKRNY